MAFVLDVNLRIQEIIGLQKLEAALAKTKGTVQAGAVAGGALTAGAAAGGAGGIAAASKAQAVAAAANAAAMNKVTIASNQLATSLSKTAGATRKSSTGMAAATGKADSFGKSVAIAGKRYAAFLAATIIPFAALGGISKATAAVIEFDSAMLKMRQITGQTEAQMAGMRNTIIDLAASTGTAASEIARVGKILSQAGQRGDVLKESLTALSKVPLTPSFETMDAAIEGTIAALNQFRKEGLSTTEVLDVLTAVSNKFAASSEDIAKGISRGGAAFEAIGGTFREFVSIFTTIRQATRESAETIGTFMKTISSRLADPKIVNFLEGKGIRISEAIEAGDPVSAIKRIAAALSETASIQDKIEIGTKLGGRRQISRLLALVSNIDILDDTLRTAGASAGEFGKIAEVGLQGLQAQLNILVQEFNKLVQTLAEPLFVPIIRGVTTVGKAFVTFIDIIKPVIPALTAIIGFAAGFKLLALSIGAAGKAMAFLSTVGVGGGIPGVLAALSGGAAGGMAGATAKERIRQRLAGGVGLGAGGAAVGGAAGARALGGLAGAATSSLGQLAGAAAIILAADKISDAFERAGNSSGILAAEFVKIAGIIVVAASLLSGKSISNAIGSFIGFMSPWGAAIGAAIAALGIFTGAATKAVDFDVQNILDAAARKVSEIEVPTIAKGDRAALQETVGVLGIEALRGIQESANRFNEGFSGVMASFVSRLGNLFTGEGLLSISDADAQRMIDDIIGNNPELLNEILRSSIEQFGVGGIEVGLDKLLAESFGGNLEAASRVREAMIKQLGGLEKIANTIDKVQIDAKVSLLANAIEKASREFETLRVPVQLTHELSSLSDAVGRAAREIEINAKTFSALSQVVGQNIGVAQPGSEFSREAVENIARQGGLGDLIDLSQFQELEGFTTDMARVGTALENFMKSIIKSSADADSLRSLLADPKVDPFDILSDYIDKFMDEYPQQIPPEAEAAFKAAAASLGQQIKDMLVKHGGILPSTEEVQKAFDDVLGKQTPFYDAAITTFKTWLDRQAQQLNLALAGEELLAGVEVGTSALSSTIVDSLQNALQTIDMDLSLPRDYKVGLMDVNDVMIDLAQNGDLVGKVLSQYETSYKKHAELNRQVAEAQQTGEGASAGLLKAANGAAIEVLNLQVVLTQLAKVAQMAPQAFSEQQQKREELGLETGGEAAAKFSEHLSKSAEKMSELINRQRQFIEAQAAVDVAQVFEKPADIFARALSESASAVRSFTSALTTQDLQKGLGVLGTKVTPEGRVFTERRPVPEARTTGQQVAIERNNLQSALFGSNIGNVLETMREVAANMASSSATRQFATRDYERSDANRELSKTLDEFSGFIFDIPKLIGESGLDAEAVANATAKALQEQATTPGSAEVEFIGALKRTIGDLTNSIKTLIERPEVARRPEELTSQLTPQMLDFLQNLSQPTSRVPEVEAAPRVFEDISASAADIQQAASDTRIAADATTRSTEGLVIASTDMKQGGTDILAASQSMMTASQLMQAISDTQREAMAGQQQAATDGVEGEVAREAIAETTEAVRSLGERVDAVAKAVDIQTQQEAELAAEKQEKPLEVEGLEENTEALNESSEVTGKAQENMSELSDGMTTMAGAMKEGVAIDVETMSEVKIDVQGVADAAQEFTAEFEEVAVRVAQEQIRIILQQLAAASGNSELAKTFESVL